MEIRLQNLNDFSQKSIDDISCDLWDVFIQPARDTNMYKEFNT